MSFQSPERLRTMSQPEKFGNVLPLFDQPRLDSLMDLIATNGTDSRMRQKLNGIMATDNTYIPLGPIDPFSLPEYYENPEANTALTSLMGSDGNTAVDLGIRWRMYGDPADAAAVARILLPWTTIQTLVNNGASRLVWSDKWTLFIQAAQLIDGSPAYTTSLRNAFRSMVQKGLVLSTAPVQTANRASWGVSHDIAAGAFLKDRALFDYGIKRWRELFEHDVKNNIPIEEITRESNGLHYCNFLLDAMTQAAEIARFNGEWLYDIQGSDGSTFKGLWDTVSGWTARPESYPYWANSSTVRIRFHVDPLHILWPNEDSAFLIGKYTTTQDNVGYRQGMLAYRYRPLYD